MIKIENIETYGWEAAIRGMRNPLNSWDKSDSDWVDENVVWQEDDPIICAIGKRDDLYAIGPNDKQLMLSLAKGGPVHAKFRRMLTITMDITAPLYWWKEFDTYKVGTVANSCSTMHKIAEKEFTLDDFSHEHLIGMEALLPPENNPYPSLLVDFSDEKCPDAYYRIAPEGILVEVVSMLNECRKWYLTLSKLVKEEQDENKLQHYVHQRKLAWWQMIQLLPSSYNQKRTVQLNYEVAHNIYISRKDHKLDCWRTLCDVLKDLPFAKGLIYDVA